MDKNAFYYVLLNGDKPPYHDTQYILADVGSLIYFDGREYEVDNWQIDPNPEEDEETCIHVICNWTGGSWDDKINSLIRDKKINDLLDGN